MGLAATQARLLFITSRQNDVSANMQKISNQNMILARDEELIADKYNRMLNDVTVTQLKKDVDLSYPSLMGSGYTITDANGNIVLPDSYKGVNDIDGLRNKLGQGSVSDATRIAANKFTENYGINDFTTKTVNYSEALKNMSFNTNNIKLITGKYTDAMTSGTKTTKTESMFANQHEKYDWGKDGNLNIYTLAQGNASTILYTDDGAADKYTNSAEACAQNITTIAEAMIQQLVEALGVDEEAMKAYVQSLVEQSYPTGTNTGKGSTAKAAETALEEADKGLIGHSSMGTYDYYSINLSELARRLIQQAMSLKTGGKVSEAPINFDRNTKDSFANLMNNSTYTTSVNSAGKTYEEWSAALKGQTSDVQDYILNGGGKDGSNLQYIINAINNGKVVYVPQNEINDGIKNGKYYIDGKIASQHSEWYEQIDNSAEATAKAEAYWKTEMAKINKKEKQLDTELQKLQTEYQALTNDLSSVQNILNKNIERSFTYCQNG